VKMIRLFVRCSTMGLAVALSPIAFAQSDVTRDGGKTAHHDKEMASQRPKLTLNADRYVGLAPTRISLTAHLAGGANGDHEFDCPTVEWEWGDGTESASSSVCRSDPQRPADFPRNFSVEHVFEQGEFQIKVRLLSGDKVVASAGTDIIIKGGLDDAAFIEDGDGDGVRGEPTGVPGFDVTSNLSGEGGDH
jgi:hypothetical protein